MSILFKTFDPAHAFEKAILLDKTSRYFRRTPFITTLCETIVTEFDLHAYIELGLRVVRFRMTNVTLSDKYILLELLSKALDWYCKKYDTSTWPIALSIDVPNVCIKTGRLEKKKPDGIYINEESVVAITTDANFMNKCTERLLFIDDPYAMANLKPGTEITFDFGTVVVTCTKKINDTKMECKTVKGGVLYDHAFVCIRGLKHCRPELTDKDIEIIDFAKDLKFDVVTINSVRNAKTVERVREMFKGCKIIPLLLSTICEQQGLDNMDSIIEISDGIVLAREFLSDEIKNKYKMFCIQLYASAKCRAAGKPFYISGNILENTMLRGSLTGCDVSDITNAVLQRCGFVLRKFKDPENLVKAMFTINEICTYVEPLAIHDHYFWRMPMEYKMPVNAAEAAVVGTVLLAKVTRAMIIIVPSVTGKTIRQVAHMSTDNVIVGITSKEEIARQLQLFRGVIAIFYDKKRLKNWQAEMDARIIFAVAYSVKFRILERGAFYIVLRKSNPTCSYCDQASVFMAQHDEDSFSIQVEKTKKELKIEEHDVNYEKTE